MKQKVFISHSSEDKGLARIINKDLTLNKVNTFFDEKDILLGDNLEEIIYHSIENECTHLIWLVSNNSIKSDWVKKEIEKAKEKMLNNIMFSKIILIKIEDCAIPDFFQKFLYMDISGMNRYWANGKYCLGNEMSTKTYETLIEKLLEAIRNERFLLKKEDLKNVENNINKEYSFNNTFTTYVNYYAKKSYFLIHNEQIKLKRELKHSVDEICPIKLSSIFFKYFKNLQFGDEIIIKHNNSISVNHFAGYSKSIDGIMIRAKARRELGLEIDWEQHPYTIYNVLINADFEKKIFDIKSINHTCKI